MWGQESQYLGLRGQPDSANQSVGDWFVQRKVLLEVETDKLVSIVSSDTNLTATLTELSLEPIAKIRLESSLVIAREYILQHSVPKLVKMFQVFDVELKVKDLFPEHWIQFERNVFFTAQGPTNHFTNK